MTGDSGAAVRNGLYIDGQWGGAGGGRTIEVIDPATEAVVSCIPCAEDVDVQRAIDAARRALPGWRATLA